MLAETYTCNRSLAVATGSRAKGLQQRSLEVLDQLGVAERVLSFGRTDLPTQIHDGAKVVTELNTTSGWPPSDAVPYPDLLWIPQWRVEQVLRELLGAFGVRVELAHELTDLAQDADSVTATVRHHGHPAELRADYVVGCDGGHSAVRQLLGIAFDGETFTEEQGLVGDVEVDGLDRDHGHIWAAPDRGFLGLTPLPSTDAFQLQASVPWDPRPEPSLETFQRIVDEVAGVPELRLRKATWLSSAQVNVRMVDRYRAGRGLLAGDAAHCHSPAGGQGMNTGIQDAHNLGWKLAHVLRGADPALLDTYQEERLPVARRVLDDSEARRRRASEHGVNGLRGLAADRDTSGLTISYRDSSLSEDWPAPSGDLRAGDRAPDAVNRDTGERLFDLLRGPQWNVLVFGDTPQALDGDVRVHPIGEQWQAHDTYGVDQNAVFVVRPDGHLGFVARQATDEPLSRYLSTSGALSR